MNLSGRVVKTVGDSLTVNVEKSGSGDHNVSWTKVMDAGDKMLLRNLKKATGMVKF